MSFQIAKFGTCVVTEIKSGRQKQCQFPFIWKGVKNYGCTTVDGGGKSWCSTKVIPGTFQHDENHSYYGDCNENNPACFNSGPGNVHYNHLINYFNHHVCLSMWNLCPFLCHTSLFYHTNRPSQTSAGNIQIGTTKTAPLLTSTIEIRIL